MLMLTQTTDKIRYAKYQCSRILKALKVGEDPNAGSPGTEAVETPVPDVASMKMSPLLPPPVDTTRPSMMSGPSALSNNSFSSVPPIIPVSIVPNPQSPSPAITPQPPSIHQSPVIHPAQPSPSINSPGLPVNPYISHPTPPPSQYNTAPPPPPSIHFNSQPPNQFNPPAPPPRPMQYQPPLQPHDPANYYTQSPRPPPTAPVAPPSNYYSQPSAPSQPPFQQQPPFQPQPSPSYFPQQTPQPVVDDEAIARSQKHARWAISALNYEDVETAVKELRIALQELGSK